MVLNDIISSLAVLTQQYWLHCSHKQLPLEFISHVVDMHDIPLDHQILFRRGSPGSKMGNGYLSPGSNRETEGGKISYMIKISIWSVLFKNSYSWYKNSKLGLYSVLGEKKSSVLGLTLACHLQFSAWQDGHCGGRSPVQQGVPGPPKQVVRMRTACWHTWVCGSETTRGLQLICVRQNIFIAMVIDFFSIFLHWEHFYTQLFLLTWRSGTCAIFNHKNSL